MKKLIILCLLAASAFARPLTDFVEPNGMVYAFVECDTALLDTPIPVGIKWSAKADGTQKTLREFIFTHMTYDFGNGRTVFLLASKEAPDYRNDGATVEDLQLWEQYLTAYGYPSDVWKTLGEWESESLYEVTP